MFIFIVIASSFVCVVKLNLFNNSEHTTKLRWPSSFSQGEMRKTKQCNVRQGNLNKQLRDTLLIIINTF